MIPIAIRTALKKVGVIVLAGGAGVKLQRFVIGRGAPLIAKSLKGKSGWANSNLSRPAGASL